MIGIVLAVYQDKESAEDYIKIYQCDFDHRLSLRFECFVGWVIVLLDGCICESCREEFDMKDIHCIMDTLEYFCSDCRMEYKKEYLI